MVRHGEKYVKTPVCTFKTPPCVRSKRPRVYWHQAHMYEKCGLGAGTHADVLNVHTETRSMQTPVLPPLPSSPTHTTTGRSQAAGSQAAGSAPDGDFPSMPSSFSLATVLHPDPNSRHRGCKTTHNTQHRRQKINTYPFSPSLPLSPLSTNTNTNTHTKTHKLSSTQPHERTNERTNGQIDRQTDRQIQTNTQTNTYKSHARQDKTSQDETRQDETRRVETGRVHIHTHIRIYKDISIPIPIPFTHTYTYMKPIRTDISGHD